MTIDEKTPHLKLPLPHQENCLEDDLPRLRQSLAKLDADAVAQGAVVNGLAQRAVTLEARAAGLVLAQGRTAAELEAHQAADDPHHTPVATRERAGLVQVGEGIAVEPNGLISVTPVPTASKERAGVVRIGQGLQISEEGILSAEIPEAFPVGGIILWSGTLDAVPAGWKLCDGTDGAPDLRDRFIVGAGKSYSAGEQGGNVSAGALLSGATGAAALSVSQMPSHNHSYTRAGSSGEYDGYDYSGRDITRTTTHTGGSSSHTHPLSDSVNIDLRPPYYALAYIIRII